jgi:hypothetical protein
MPENISGVPAGRSVFHLTSPLIGLLARNKFRLARYPPRIDAKCGDQFLRADFSLEIKLRLEP